MTRTGANTEELVRYLVESLVENPDSLSIARSDAEGSVRFEITLDAEDVGKVIGRGGRIIKAIRTLARAAGSTEGLHVDVDVLG
ncbi:MAG TPA: KH domain-containing protein [Coriobacteriia bacterium]|nr:KH domain-containing protein [Coriobacteriia bacterium]